MLKSVGVEGGLAVESMECYANEPGLSPCVTSFFSHFVEK